ncbi:carbohydrate kinase family protein [Candidatus Saccharibacteria bacterium]|nr:MAG: carbohydrate kinase family protein [Candidatus Saccharibacteria bacterium]
MGLFDAFRSKKTEETAPATAEQPVVSVEPTAPIAPEVTTPSAAQEVIQDVPLAPAVPEAPMSSPEAMQAPEAVEAPAANDAPTETTVEPIIVAPAPAAVEAPAAAPVSTVAASSVNMLVIGDIFTDAFIQLPEGSAKVIKEADGREWLALPFGQKPPYDHVDIVRSVGPSPNAAVSMARLGLTPHLMAWVGDDATGVEAIQHLKDENVGTDTMVTEVGNQTSYWYVLRYGADRTMLVKSEKYKYEWQDPAVAPEWIFLAYIGEDSWDLHEKLADYLARNPGVKFALQPGTFHFKWGTEKMKPLYAHSYITIMNREEAADVTGKPLESIHELAAGLHALGPKIVVITDGPKGSYASYDGKVVTIPNYPDPAAPLDRTGAGDAFASTIVSALAQGQTMETALTWAPINSMSVVQKLGAQAGLLTPGEVQTYLSQAPAAYVVTELSAGE